MKKKLLSMLIIGAMIAGLGATECLAAPGHHRDIKNNQHKEMKHKPILKKHAKPAQKKHVRKAPAKKHQFIQKHNQAKFKKQKQHQKEMKKHQKNNKRGFRNFFHRHDSHSRNHRR